MYKWGNTKFTFFDLVTYTIGFGAYAMTKKKRPQMAHMHPAEEALARKMDSIIDGAAESVDEMELEEREAKASKIVEDVRARASRASRKERA